MDQLVNSWWRDEDGLTTVEYALLLALIVVSAITAWQGLDTSVGNAADRASGAMTTSN
ncbi:MAG: Flp family type IVb pilin [Armatimonadota bacterium]